MCRSALGSGWCSHHGAARGRAAVGGSSCDRRRDLCELAGLFLLDAVAHGFYAFVAHPHDDFRGRAVRRESGDHGAGADHRDRLYSLFRETPQRNAFVVHLERRRESAPRAASEG